MVSEEQLIKYLCDQARDEISAEIQAELGRLNADTSAVVDKMHADLRSAFDFCTRSVMRYALYVDLTKAHGCTVRIVEPVWEEVVNALDIWHMYSARSRNGDTRKRPNSATEAMRRAYHDLLGYSRTENEPTTDELRRHVSVFLDISGGDVVTGGQDGTSTLIVRAPISDVTVSPLIECARRNKRIGDLRVKLARVSPDYVRALLTGDAVKQAGLETEVAKILTLFT